MDINDAYHLINKQVKKLINGTSDAIKSVGWKWTNWTYYPNVQLVQLVQLVQFVQFVYSGPHFLDRVFCPFSKSDGSWILKKRNLTEMKNFR